MTPTVNSLPLRRADFASLADALDYAAQGDTGANFYAGSGKLAAVLPYRTLRIEAQKLARRLLSLELERGARVAVIAETSPDFLRFFFACQYAGLVPVALPASANLGGHAAYVARLRGLLVGCGASVATASTQFLRFLREAAEGMDLAFTGTPADFDELPEQDVELHPSGPTETAYLQYTSGSTSFPRGVVITQHAVLEQSRRRGQSRSRHQARRPLRLVAAVLPRHGSRRLHARADGDTALDRLSRHARFRDAAAPLARVDDQHEGDDLVQPAVRLRALRAPDSSRRRRGLRPRGVAHRRHRRRAHSRRAAGPLRQAARAGRIRSPRVRPLLRHGRKLARDQFLAAQERRGRRLDRRRSPGGAFARDSRRSATRAGSTASSAAAGRCRDTRSPCATTREGPFPIFMSGA